MKKESNIVTTNQLGINKNLCDIAKRNIEFEFKKPYSDFSIETFKNIIDWIELKNINNIILDIGCGVGESTINLANKYQDCLVIGIDKSLDRIKRNNDFKKNIPENMLLVRGNVIDLWPMFLERKKTLNIVKQYILYPNPYPKEKHVKLRWHGHPIFQSILNIKSPIEVRSNWRLYLEEFEFMVNEYGQQFILKLELFTPEKSITPFERKFLESSQDLFVLNLTPL